MRVLALALFAATTSLIAADTVAVFGGKWTLPVGTDWKVEGEGSGAILHLITHRGPVPGPPRRPTQFALAQTDDFGNVTVEADVRPLQKSLIIVFAYRDAAHFDYAHLSVDTGIKQPVHNGVFHVFGGERVRISSQGGPPAFAATGRWYHVRLSHDGKSGEVNVSVDGVDVPALHAVDVSLLKGKVGLGSFDETGDFKNVKISGD